MTAREKQLNIWIDESLKDALYERAQNEKTSIKAITEGILRQEIALRNGERIEQRALPIVREIVATEVQKAVTELLQDLRQELHSELLKEIDGRLRRHIDRMEKLAICAAREASISRRLQNAHLSRAYGLMFAKEMYESAQEDAKKDLSDQVRRL